MTQPQERESGVIGRTLWADLKSFLGTFPSEGASFSALKPWLMEWTFQRVDSQVGFERSDAQGVEGLKEDTSERSAT